MKIVDGKGRGYSAEVDADNKFHVLATTRSENELATIDGESFNINTGVMTITGTLSSALLYLKNNETRGIHVEALAVGIISSNSSTSAVTTVVRNPTSGDIIGGASAVDIESNRNFGSSKTLDVDAYKGAAANTFNDGDDSLIFQHNPSSRLFATIDLYIPQGKSIGIKVLPPGGNSSMEIYIAVVCHLEKENA